MRKVDPGIVLIASGAMPDAMTASKESLKLDDKLVPEFLGRPTGRARCSRSASTTWTCSRLLPLPPTSTSPARSRSQCPDEALVDWMPPPANHIRLKYGAQEYIFARPRAPAEAVPIALDEYAYTFGGQVSRSVPAYA